MYFYGIVTTSVPNIRDLLHFLSWFNEFHHFRIFSTGLFEVFIDSLSIKNNFILLFIRNNWLRIFYNINRLAWSNRLRYNGFYLFLLFFCVLNRDFSLILVSLNWLNFSCLLLLYLFFFHWLCFWLINLLCFLNCSILLFFFLFFLLKLLFIGCFVLIYIFRILSWFLLIFFVILNFLWANFCLCIFSIFIRTFNIISLSFTLAWLNLFCVFSCNFSFIFLNLEFFLFCIFIFIISFCI